MVSGLGNNAARVFDALFLRENKTKTTLQAIDL
jgi:hypothetical protein